MESGEQPRYRPFEWVSNGNLENQKSKATASLQLVTLPYVANIGLGSKCKEYASNCYSSNNSTHVEPEWRIISSWYDLEKIATRAWDCGSSPLYHNIRRYRNWDIARTENEAILEGTDFSERIWEDYRGKRVETPSGVQVQIHEAQMITPEDYVGPLFPFGDGPLDLNADCEAYTKDGFAFAGRIYADLNMVYVLSMVVIDSSVHDPYDLPEWLARYRCSLRYSLCLVPKPDDAILFTCNSIASAFEHAYRKHTRPQQGDVPRGFITMDVYTGAIVDKSAKHDRPHLMRCSVALECA